MLVVSGSGMIRERGGRRWPGNLPIVLRDAIVGWNSRDDEFLGHCPTYNH